MRTLLVLSAALFAAFASSAEAQNYPRGPIRLIVAYPPGGSADIMGRLAGEALTKAWGVQVITDNRPGFNGNIGAGLCAKAPPDGYTMCSVSGAQAVASSIYRTLPFDSLKDFTQVSLQAVLPQLLLVHPSLPAKNVREFIALAKSKPNSMNYASTGVAATPALTMEMFKQQTGMEISNISYKGAIPAILDQVAGRVEVAFSIAVGIVPFVQQGKLRALAVTIKERFSLFPDVPTMDESGLKGFEASSWQGIAMPAGVPHDIVNRVSVEVAKAFKTPEMREKVLVLGGIAVGNTPEEFAAFFRSESEKWSKVAKAAGVRPE